MNYISLFWKRNKTVLIFIFLIFFVTRVALVSIGTATQHFLPLTHYQNWKKELVKDQKILSLWATWDSKWYLKTADRGYEVTKPFDPQIQQSIAFFPLYSLLIACFSWVLAFGNSLIAGITISNIALIVASFLLYKLVLFDHGEEIAKRSVWYLYLFPTAYIFSAVYPESVLLLFSIGTLLAARHGKWPLAGTLGFFAALAKPVGVLVLIPALLMYLKNIGYSWKKISPQISYLALIPTGLICFGLYSYFIIGDFFAYSHVQNLAWEHRISNPFWVIWKHLMFGDGVDLFICALAIIFSLTLLAWGFKKISFSYWVYALALALFAPISGTVWAAPRYMATIFPILIILAIFGKNENADKSIVASMAILQGFLAVFWFAGFWFTA